ncbi:PREDICTED: hornerin-like [Priapulus caudatus]|uniref:Hornerin-like n=1 Tax=Priapulus caudatus TaxID=37621 RepID=A0ABM1ELG0_PRICU|nr:PREDICTED: hornerin-like [Priapulus caudatus]
MTKILAALVLCSIAALAHSEGYGYKPSYYYGFLHKHTTTTHSPYVYFKRHTIPYEDLYESTYTDHYVFHTPSPCYGYHCDGGYGGGGGDYGGDYGGGVGVGGGYSSGGSGGGGGYSSGGSGGGGGYGNDISGGYGSQKGYEARLANTGSSNDGYADYGKNSGGYGNTNNNDGGYGTTNNNNNNNDYGSNNNNNNKGYGDNGKSEAYADYGPSGGHGGDNNNNNQGGYGSKDNGGYGDNNNGGYGSSDNSGYGGNKDGGYGGNNDGGYGGNNDGGYGGDKSIQGYSGGYGPGVHAAGGGGGGGGGGYGGGIAGGIGGHGGGIGGDIGHGGGRAGHGGVGGVVGAGYGGGGASQGYEYNYGSGYDDAGGYGGGGYGKGQGRAQSGYGQGISDTGVYGGQHAGQYGGKGRGGHGRAGYGGGGYGGGYGGSQGGYGSGFSDGGYGGGHGVGGGAGNYPVGGAVLDKDQAGAYPQQPFNGQPGQEAYGPQQPGQNAYGPQQPGQNVYGPQPQYQGEFTPQIGGQGQFGPQQQQQQQQPSQFIQPGQDYGRGLITPQQGGQQVGEAVSGQDVVQDISTECDAARRTMRVTVKMANGFQGQVFARGYFGQPRCSSQGYGSNYMQFEMPLDGCGTAETPDQSQLYQQGNPGFTYRNTLIMMGHPGILGSTDRAYTVQCQTGGTVQPVNIVNEVGNTNPPNVFMKVSNGKDPNSTPSEGLTVGETATLSISHKENPTWDVYVTNCYAHDGVGVNKVLLIDEDGCPAHDPEFVSSMQHDRLVNGDVVHYTNFQSFKFPDKNNVYFQCTVEVCRDKCHRSTCTATPSNRRKRDANATEVIENEIEEQKPRSKDTVEEEIEVFRGLTIILPGEQPIPRYWNARYAVQDEMCITKTGFAWGMAIMGGVLIVAIIICVLLCMRTRNESRKHLDAPEHFVMSKA